jgi:arginyl-tRNA synthetase
MDYKKEFSKLIFLILNNSISGINNNNNNTIDEINALVLVPPLKELGDLSFPTFQLAKTYKKAPQVLAKELILKLPKSDLFEFSEVNGYINAKINEKYLIKETISTVIKENKNYGKSNLDNNQYVIDTFNANPLKMLHIGHLRNIVTGDFVSNILKFVGADPKPASYGGDIGTHIAKWYWYYLKLSDKEKIIPEKDVSKWFGNIYIKAGQLVETNPDVYKQEIDDIQVKIMNSVSLQEEIKLLAMKSHDAYMQIGKELNVYIDNSFFESASEDKFLSIKEKLFSDNKDLFIESDGAIVADLKDKILGNFILIKQNGAPLYGAKDIGLVLLKKEIYPLAKHFLYVTASEQDFYFKQLFALYKFIYPDTNHFHISHGLVNTLDGKMKSRAGESFLYEDFRDKLFSSVKAKLIENGLDVDDTIVNDISFGVIKFEMLKTNLNKNVIFDIISALDFQGDSSLYVQYSGVRAKSILNKSKFKDIDLELFDPKYVIEKDEVLLCSKINEFKDKVVLAYNEYKSHIIANYVLELAHTFNKFYTNCPVLVENENTKTSRLLLIKAFLITLENALDLLGINIPIKM